MDISGSMYPSKRLPLAQRAMCLLVDELRDQDTVTIVVYASSTGTVLEATSGSDKETIKNAIYGLRAGGSTNGAGGIQLAYEEAGKNFVKGGNNRVILCTDGDFNVGVSSVSALEDLIVEQREGGVFLSILGFGMGNVKDNKMETLATKGNGNYAYIDNLKEAKKVLVDDMTGTIFTIAKDVKLQVEFNPETVSAYRLIGYEKRLLNDEDFNNDAKDAGEMGAGHSMIAFYEIIPAGVGDPGASELKYQTPQTTGSDELMNINLRYKKPDSDVSILMEPVAVSGLTDAPPSEIFNFASAVAEWGLILENSEFKANASILSVLNRAYENRGHDVFGYRAEFIQLVDLSRLIQNRNK
jgi:Ca-activated chloride channel family protein